MSEFLALLYNEKLVSEFLVPLYNEKDVSEFLALLYNEKCVSEFVAQLYSKKRVSEFLAQLMHPTSFPTSNDIGANLEMDFFMQLPKSFFRMVHNLRFLPLNFYSLLAEPDKIIFSCGLCWFSYWS